MNGSTESSAVSRVPQTALPRLTLVVLTAVLIASGKVTATELRPSTGPTSITEAVREFIVESDAPSVSVAIGCEGEIVFSEALGVADLEHLVPATEETVYRMASVAKPITATAVMKLVESGKLDLSAPIQQYVPSFTAPAEAISLRDLLRHTGGIRHYRDGEFASTYRCDELEDALAIFAEDPMANEPGEMVTYSSYGYVLLGLAIESASGMSYADYVQRFIFAPAGMHHSVVDDVHAIIPKRADGYATTDGRLRRADLVDTSCRIPAGGFVSTAGDLIRFGLALLDGRLVSRKAVQEMLSSQVPQETVARTLEHLQAPPEYKPPGLGLGWSIGTASHPEAVLHGGNQQGATAMLYLVPEKNIAISILANIEGRGEAITELADQLHELVQDHCQHAPSHGNPGVSRSQ